MCKDITGHPGLQGGGQEKNSQKKLRAEEEDRHKGSMTPLPPKNHNLIFNNRLMNSRGENTPTRIEGVSLNVRLQYLIMYLNQITKINPFLYLSRYEGFDGTNIYNIYNRSGRSDTTNNQTWFVKNRNTLWTNS
jgi:hypothetical protein